MKKINRLHELINTIGEASSTETDLLKAYVIDLYEAVAMSDIEQAKDLEIAEMKKEMKRRRKAEKKLKKSVNKKYNIESPELVVSKNESSIPVVEKVEPIEHQLSKAENVVVEMAAKESTSSKANGSSVISQEIKDLFDIEEMPELSDKLANAPISDLTKAMGINEKIFTQKELFGGDQKEMDNILLAMNGLSNFDEAKSVMMKSVAVKYDWTAPSRIKKAKNFIKFVRRRYN
ncbi:MAG: hypothetical protein HKN51_05295 [Saprospiraceae bacterium]|nr:hypothetical protein [Saprospiraceae bacterium]